MIYSVDLYANLTTAFFMKIYNYNVQRIFPKLYRCLLYVVFHNLESQHAGLVELKKIKGSIFAQKSKKKHRYLKCNWG